MTSLRGASQKQLNIRNPLLWSLALSLSTPDLLPPVHHLRPYPPPPATAVNLTPSPTFPDVMDSNNFDFTLGGELQDDVVDVEDVELEERAQSRNITAAAADAAHR
ncbi:hypothetical protein RHMOL_Rhmol13G0153500 [Rhododendron molle]|uniref:Uncharacterized protein n=1 Tax=Rhododendron molle TaxID=49168 RepID=A0ACC0L822_RHOML|nr:hypothetical protein RHMOL_Rhmol13G0153500 [Rhododendron molle]